MINDFNYQVLTETNEQESLPIKIKWHQKFYYCFKSICDILIAFIALVVLLPLFIGVAIAIKIDITQITHNFILLVFLLLIYNFVFIYKHL